MKKCIIILSLLLSVSLLADTPLEDRLEDILEEKYEYISDGKVEKELDIEVKEYANEVVITLEVEDSGKDMIFSTKEYKKLLREIEQDAKEEMRKESTSKKVRIRTLRK